MDIRTEHATHKVDLPHKFATLAQAGACQVCGSPEGDPRHVTWARTEAASRETASSPEMVRELGI
jgi:hypothetical protein